MLFRSIESPGQRELVGKFAPDSFNDLIIGISLFRPGPVKGDMIAPFLETRQGFQKRIFIHQDLIYLPTIVSTYLSASTA